MEPVLGIREERCYKTPALMSAKERAKKYWQQAHQIPSIALDSKTHAILNQELPSLQKLYNVYVRMALVKPTEFSREDGGHGSLVIVNEPGGRRWDQRAMAIAAQQSTNTARKNLKRLKELGLVWFETSRRCTYVFVEGIRKIIKGTWWRSVVCKNSERPKKKSVSKTDTFPSPRQPFSILEDLIDGKETESKTKKEGEALQKPQIPPEARAYLDSLKQ